MSPTEILQKGETIEICYSAILGGSFLGDLSKCAFIYVREISVRHTHPCGIFIAVPVYMKFNILLIIFKHVFYSSISYIYQAWLCQPQIKARIYWGGALFNNKYSREIFIYCGQVLICLGNSMIRGDECLPLLWICPNTCPVPF